MTRSKLNPASRSLFQTRISGYASFPVLMGISLVLGVILLVPSCTKEHDGILASMGWETITVDAFRERLRSALQLSSTRDNLWLRKNLLSLMVTESILLAEARRQGIDKRPEVQAQLEWIEKHLLLNSYQRNVVQDTVTLDEGELRDAFVRMNQKVSARHLFARTREEADDLLQQLHSGVPFEDLAAKTFQDSALASNGGYLGYFGSGDMDPAFEEAAFRMKIGEISEPVQTAYGYSIIRVEDRIVVPILTDSEFQKNREKLKNALKKVKSMRASEKLVSDLGESLSIEVQPRAFDYLVDQWRKDEASFFENASAEGRSLRTVPYPLEGKLVRFKGGSWTIRDFLKHACSVPFEQKIRVKTEEDLKKLLQGMIIREELLKRARKSGLAERDDVKKRIDRETKACLIDAMRKTLTDSVRVSPDAVRTQYDGHMDQYVFPEEADVREILVPTRETADSILQKIRQGEDFSELAKWHTIREWAVEKGGELGFAPRSRFGSLADAVFAMKAEEVIGPLKIADAYSIIKMVGKRDTRQKTLEEAAPQIEAELVGTWKEKALTEFQETWKKKHPVRLNETLLAALVL